MIFLTSDPHYGHQAVINYETRPFSSVENMTACLIENFNKVVKPTDLTFFLGDVFFCNKAEARRIMAALNGKKVLIKGNHCDNANAMYGLGFEFVCEFAQIRVGKTYVNLSHYPYKRFIWNHLYRKHFDPKYRAKLHYKRLKDDGNWLCHGHTHGKERVRDKMIHVGVDAWSYKPVPITEISSIIAKHGAGK